jgi:hypothetical protein
MYRDVNGNQNYIESIGIDQDGKMVAIIRTNQSVKNRSNNTETHVARTVVDASEIPLNGLSNAKQADKIRQTYNNMLPMWSANFAGREPQQNFQEDINVLGDIEVEQGPPVNQPPAPVRSFMEDNPPPAPKQIEISIEEWKDMNLPQQRNFIIEEATKRNSESVEYNGRERRKWDTLTPKQRSAEIRKVRKELERELNIKL